MENRPLTVYQFGYGQHAKMIIAGIHGGYEWNTIKLADEMIETLTQNPGMIPNNVTLYILRSLNPDGETRGHGITGRANANNVDLNRNWDNNWTDSWPWSGCWNFISLSAGDSPGSEPETRALAAFLIEKKIEAIISYHSAGLGIFPGGQPPDPDSTSLADMIAQLSPYPYPPVDTGCLYTGQLIDWASFHGIAAVDVELTNHRDTDFEINIDILQEFMAWLPPDE